MKDLILSHWNSTTTKLGLAVLFTTAGLVIGIGNILGGDHKVK